MKILSFEKSILEWIKTHLNILFPAVMTVIAIMIRYYGKDFVGGDMAGYFIPWHEEYVKNGFSALGEQVGDYNIPYQVFVFLISRVPIQEMYMYKLINGAMDFLLAYTGYQIVKLSTGSSSAGTIAYVSLLFLPEVIFNSSYLGQCDSIFTTFALLALLFLMKEKYLLSFVFLGCSFAFKLQFVFIVPVFVIAYVIRQKFSALNFLIVPLMLMVLSIPAYIAGRPVLDVFRMYFFQVYQYHDMSLGFPSFWTLVGITEFKVFYKFAILITVAVLGLILYFIMKRNIDLSRADHLLLIAALTSWTCVLFLPDMHERYGYLADVLLVLLCVTKTKYFPYAFVPALVSTCVYFSHYQTLNLRAASLIYFAAYLICMIKAYRDHSEKAPEQELNL